jgi:hypothetical protein
VDPDGFVRHPLGIGAWRQRLNQFQYVRFLVWDKRKITGHREYPGSHEIGH